MKTIKWITVLLAICFAINANAQSKTLSVKVGEKEKKGMMEGIIGVVGTDDDGFYVLRSKSKGFAIYGMGVGTRGEMSIDKYSNNLQHQKTLEITGIPATILNKAKDKSYEFIVQDGKGKIWLFYSDEKGGKNQLYRKELNKKAFKFEKAELVSEQKIMDKKLDRRSSYGYVQSEDKKLLGVYSVVGNKKSAASYAYIEVFDENMNSLWASEDKVPEYSDGKVSKAFEMAKQRLDPGSNNLILTNKGVINIYKSLWQDNEGIFTGGDIVHVMYSFSGKKSDPVVKRLENDNLNILDALISQDKDGGIRLTGFYSESEKERSIDGVFFQSINPESLKTVDASLVPFTDEHKKSFLTSVNDLSRKGKASKRDEKTKKKIDKGKDLKPSTRNNITSVNTLSDNSTLMGAEFFMQTTRMRTTRDANGNTRQEWVTVYNFGDLKYIKINEDGKIEWIKNFDKRQRAENSYAHLGVYEMFVDNNMYFVYNDLENKVLRLGNITPEGEVKSKTITDLGKKGKLEKFWFAPRMTTELSDNSFLGVAVRLFKSKFLKLTFK